MTALLIVLAVLLGIGSLPVGSKIRYEDGELAVKLAFGPLSLQILPSKPLHGKKLARQFRKKLEREWAARQKKVLKKLKKRRNKEDRKGLPRAQRAPKQRLSLEELLPLAKLGLQIVGSLPRKLLVRELYLHLVCGGKDAAKAAISYGRAWAMLGTVLPVLERVFRVRKRDLGVELDYDRASLEISARLDIRMRVGTAFLLALTAGARFLLLLSQNKNKTKQEKAVQVT